MDLTIKDLIYLNEADKAYVA